MISIIRADRFFDNITYENDQERSRVHLSSWSDLLRLGETSLDGERYKAPQCNHGIIKIAWNKKQFKRVSDIARSGLSYYTSETFIDQKSQQKKREIGRASCRERM